MTGGLISQLISGLIVALSGTQDDAVHCLISLATGLPLGMGNMVSAMVDTDGPEGPEGMVQGGLGTWGRISSMGSIVGLETQLVSTLGLLSQMVSPGDLVWR